MGYFTDLHNKRKEAKKEKKVKIKLTKEEKEIFDKCYEDSIIGVRLCRFEECELYNKRKCEYGSMFYE